MVSSEVFFGAVLLTCFCCLLPFVETSNRSNPLVETTLGKVRGSLLKTEKGNDVFAFRGIRYAEAPIGGKRFKAPSGISKWEGEFDATKDGAICPQVFQWTQLLARISEDCLFLNVYSRSLKGANSSVVVYIHGGMNVYGSGHSLSGFGPEYLLDRDIVLVTFNYRLGPFGFLSLDSAEAPGNYGYLDQVMVLQWVQQHISGFGGNPDSVTLMGVSAGAMAVTLHMASPLSKRLFHRAIAMSGSATSDIILDSVKWSRKLAHETSCPMYNSEDVLSCLRELSWETIVNVCYLWELYNLPNMKWGYQVDGHFMQTSLTDSFERGNFSRIPILTGLSRDELAYSVHNHENNTGLLNDFSVNFHNYASECFMHDLDNALKVKKLKNFYLGNRTINDQNLTNFGAIFSDALIGHSVHRLVNLAKKSVDVYYYRFDYVGRFGKFIDPDGMSRGVSHGDELLYLENVQSKFTEEDPEWFMVERMVGMISSFAENGSPEDMNGTTWLPTNKTHLNTMYIDTNSQLAYAPFTERFRLWDELFPLNCSMCLYTFSFIVIFMTLLLLLF